MECFYINEPLYNYERRNSVAKSSEKEKSFFDAFNSRDQYYFTWLSLLVSHGKVLKMVQRKV